MNVGGPLKSQLEHQKLVIEQVTSFNYLVAEISSSGILTSEVPNKVTECSTKVNDAI